jgi:hypothetical protein
VCPDDYYYVCYVQKWRAEEDGGGRREIQLSGFMQIAGERASEGRGAPFHSPVGVKWQSFPKSGGEAFRVQCVQNQCHGVRGVRGGGHGRGIERWSLQHGGGGGGGGGKGGTSALGGGTLGGGD